MKSISEERLVRWQEHAHQLASLLDVTHILPIFRAKEKRANATEHLREQQGFTGSGSSATGTDVQALEGLNAQR